MALALMLSSCIIFVFLILPILILILIVVFISPRLPLAFLQHQSRFPRMYPVYSPHT
ncbi:hypothetical protein FKP32DRAFT_1597576 [Trametes sanguinea]|nr:hypothetical protein FKP32DRAFT_1597576 [Trametes sanguinea]